MAGSPIRVPYLDVLTQFVERAKSLSKTMDRFTYGKLCLGENIVLKVGDILRAHLISEWRAECESDTPVQQGRHMLTVNDVFKFDREFVRIFADFGSQAAGE
jgi:hypothetical protein